MTSQTTFTKTVKYIELSECKLGRKFVARTTTTTATISRKIKKINQKKKKIT